MNPRVNVQAVQFVYYLIVCRHFLTRYNSCQIQCHSRLATSLDITAHLSSFLKIAYFQTQTFYWILLLWQSIQCVKQTNWRLTPKVIELSLLLQQEEYQYRVVFWCAMGVQTRHFAQYTALHHNTRLLSVLPLGNRGLDRRKWVVLPQWGEPYPK